MREAKKPHYGKSRQASYGDKQRREEQLKNQNPDFVGTGNKLGKKRAKDGRRKPPEGVLSDPPTRPGAQSIGEASRSIRGPTEGAHIGK